MKLVTTKRRRNYLVSEPIIFLQIFHRTSISIGNKKTEILMSKPVCPGLSILELSKMLMHEFRHDYVKPKYVEKAKLC